MEEWRDIPGYEGLYAVSSEGRVWAHSKIKWNTLQEARLLNPFITSGGYRALNLSKNNQIKQMIVARLVCLAFLGVPEESPRNKVPDHINNNKIDDRLENLRWATPSQNNSNKKPIGKSGYLGIIIKPRKAKPFEVRIKCEKKLVYCKCFKTLEEALKARKLMAFVYHGLGK